MRSAGGYLEVLRQKKAELIERAVKGDNGAFAEIVDQFGPRINSIAYQMSGNSDDARDITQEVFIRLFRSLRQFKAEYEFATWLYRLTINLSIDFLRRNRQHRHESAEVADRNLEISDKNPRPDEKLERNELKGAIRVLTGDLSINQRRVLVLRDLQGFTTEEIARILKCRVSTVRVHLARARHRMKEMLLEKYPELMEEHRP